MEQRTHTSMSNFLCHSIPNCCQAKIWRVDDPFRIWVSLENPKGHREATLQHLQEFRPNQPGIHRVLEEGLYPGAPVLWWSGDDTGFFRAICLGDYQNPRQIRIYCGDWAWTRIVDMDDLYHMPFRFRGDPWTLVSCGLAGVRPVDEEWTERAKLVMRELVGKTLWMRVIYDDVDTDAVWVDMSYVHDFRRHVGVELVEQGHAVFDNEFQSFTWGETGGSYCDRAKHSNYESLFTTSSTANTTPPENPWRLVPTAPDYDSEATTEIFVPTPPRVRTQRRLPIRRRRRNVRRVLRFTRQSDSESEPEWFYGREHSDGE